MLNLIVTVIVATIGLQMYWNYKNYGINKQQLINDVQISLDNAIESYYANLAQNRAVAFSFNSDSLISSPNAIMAIDSLFKDVELFERDGMTKDSFRINITNGDHISTLGGVDSLLTFIQNDNPTIKRRTHVSRVDFTENDTLTLQNLNTLTSKVVISMHRETLDLTEVDSLFSKELQRKSLDLKYNLHYSSPTDTLKIENKINGNGLTTVSKSPFLPMDNELSVHFTNETKTILKRIMAGMFMSTLLVLAVISCLFYLLKIIQKQKQLAEVKNDLISNITHEFKTPIATIGVALESIKNFKVIDDKEKTRTYLNMSTDQLSKLNVMVEKLLETATLDSDNLNLNKESIDLNDLLYGIIEKHKMQSNKTIIFDHLNETVLAKADPFHIDNAINNILDNAIKYGGDTINVKLIKKEGAIEVAISDSGNTLSKSQKDKIFEKFYRVHTGNTHDVKGFGIGLYYTKRIIEKHNGNISLDLNDNWTTFKIKIPNA